MIAGAYLLALNFADQLPAVQGGHSPWRYTLLFGVLPAIPLMILRPFLPESPLWAERRAAGTLSRPRFRELFEPRLRRVTILSTLLVGCAYALAFGMLQHIPRIVPGLHGVTELARKAQEQWVSYVHIHVDVGAIIGRLLFVFLAIYLVSRRRMLQAFLVSGLVVFPFVFLGPPMNRHRQLQVRGGVRVDTGECAVQLLGQLPAAGIPAAPARHWRQCSERASAAASLRRSRRSRPRSSRTCCPAQHRRSKLATSMALVVVTFTVLALFLSTRLPEPAPELPED